MTINPKMTINPAIRMIRTRTPPSPSPRTLTMVRTSTTYDRREYEYNDALFYLTADAKATFCLFEDRINLIRPLGLSREYRCPDKINFGDVFFVVTFYVSKHKTFMSLKRMKLCFLQREVAKNDHDEI